MCVFERARALKSFLYPTTAFGNNHPYLGQVGFRVFILLCMIQRLTLDKLQRVFEVVYSRRGHVATVSFMMNNLAQTWTFCATRGRWRDGLNNEVCQVLITSRWGPLRGWCCHCKVAFYYGKAAIFSEAGPACKTLILEYTCGRPADRISWV